MNYRKFGGMDWQVSEIGLGTWQLGADWGNVDDAMAEKVLTRQIAMAKDFLKKDWGNFSNRVPKR